MLRSLGKTFFVSSSYYILKRKSYSSFHLKMCTVKYFTNKKGFVAQIIHSWYAFQMIKSCLEYTNYEKTFKGLRNRRKNLTISIMEIDLVIFPDEKYFSTE